MINDKVLLHNLFTALAVRNARNSLTWKDTAKELGVSESYLSQARSGIRSLGLETWATAVKLLKCEITITINDEGIHYDVQNLDL